MTETSDKKPLFTIADIVEYYEEFRPAQMEHFARFVISKGYGATTPHGRRGPDGRKQSETWQACGRRLFGERFIPVMERMLAEHKEGMAAKPPAVIPDPEF
jgi:hypothetical protein